MSPWMFYKFNKRKEKSNALTKEYAVNKVSAYVGYCIKYDDWKVVTLVIQASKSADFNLANSSWF